MYIICCHGLSVLELITIILILQVCVLNTSVIQLGQLVPMHGRGH